MRETSPEKLSDLVGWTGRNTHEHVYHGVRSQDAEGSTGISRCSLTLCDIRDVSHVRRYERPCTRCFGPHLGDPIPTRVTARVRRDLHPPVSPVGPLDLRVTPDGLLGIRTNLDQWLVFNPAEPLLLGTADDQSADQWRTLRSTWPTETLINGVAIGDRYGQARNTVAKWRLEPEFPRVAATIADRPGWYPEQWPAIDAWVSARAIRRGRKPQKA